MTTVDTTQIFKDDIFKGKVLLCSGGGSGICRGMTEQIVRHGAKAVIISRRYVTAKIRFYEWYFHTII